MATITLNRTPEKLAFGKTSIDFDVFLVELFEYMEDLEDKNKVIKAMEENKTTGVSLNDFISKYGK